MDEWEFIPTRTGVGSSDSSQQSKESTPLNRELFAQLMLGTSFCLLLETQKNIGEILLIKSIYTLSIYSHTHTPPPQSIVQF